MAAEMSWRRLSAQYRPRHDWWRHFSSVTARRLRCGRLRLGKQEPRSRPSTTAGDPACRNRRTQHAGTARCADGATAGGGRRGPAPARARRRQERWPVAAGRDRTHRSAVAISSPGVASSCARPAAIAACSLILAPSSSTGCCGCRSDCARQPLSSTAARQQSDQRSRQAEGRPRVVCEHPVMARERELTATPQREASDRYRNRLAGGLQPRANRGSAEENGRTPAIALAQRQPP